MAEGADLLGRYDERGHKRLLEEFRQDRHQVVLDSCGIPRVPAYGDHNGMQRKLVEPAVHNALVLQARINLLEKGCFSVLGCCASRFDRAPRMRWPTNPDVRSCVRRR